MDLSAANPYIFGKAETEFGQPATIKKDLDKLDFLNLLVTQLQHQDPLDPMDDKEFVAQLAQFSSLEQLTNISSGIDGLSSAMSRQELISTATYIGKDITADGYSISKEKGKISDLYYEFDEEVSSAQMNILDENNNIVRTVSLGAMGPGRRTYSWDGKDYKGNDVVDGVYNVYIVAEGTDGQTVLANTEVSGTVTAIQHSDGKTWLSLGDGRMVDFSNVKYVVDPSTTSKSSDASDSSDSSNG